MIKQTIIKYKKLIIAVIFVLGIVVYAKMHLMSGTSIDISHKVDTVSGLSYIKDSQVIDRNMVIKSLKETHELVGLTGVSEKKYTFEDSIFKNHGWIKDWIGQRSLTIDAIAHFKTGIDLSGIGADDVRVYGNTLHIKLPKTTLISMDIPYNELIFTEKNGLIRSSLTTQEKQKLYSEIRKLFESEIQSNASIQSQTYTNVSKTLKDLLSKVPNCNRFVFSEHLQ